MMKNTDNIDHTCELVQLSISDAIDSNQQLERSDEQHMESCPDCARFHQLWQQEASLSTIASGELSEHLNLAHPILSKLEQNSKALPLTEHNVIRGKFIKLASIAAMIAIICVGALNFSDTEAQQTNIAITPIEESEAALSIKLPAIQITLTEEKIEQVLEKNYQSLSESATQKWKTATTGIAFATEYIADGTHHLSSKFLTPGNHGTSGPHSRLILPQAESDHPQYG